jgi:hypothetical protein
MGALFALNGLGYFFVSFIAFFVCYFLHKEGPDYCRVGKIIGIMGIFYALMSILNFSWVAGVLQPNGKDFALVNASVAVASSMLLLYVAYLTTGSKNLLYFFFLFITSLFAANFSIGAFVIATLGVSYAMMFIISLEFSFFSGVNLRKAGHFGFWYSSVSIALLFFVLSGKEQINLPWFLQSLAMAFVVWNIRKTSHPALKYQEEPNKIGILGYAESLLKFLIFVGTMSFFISVSTVAIHELGHAVVAQYYGCHQFKAVIYDIIGPHTEISCDGHYNSFAVTLGGLAAALAAGILFMATGSRFIGYFIIGLGLLISYGDFMDISMSKNIVSLIMLLGLIVMAIAVISISVFYLEQQGIANPEGKHAAEASAQREKNLNTLKRKHKK